VNSQLKKRSQKVQDLGKDLQDGTALISVIEIVCKLLSCIVLIISRLLHFIDVIENKRCLVYKLVALATWASEEGAREAKASLNLEISYVTINFLV